MSTATFDHDYGILFGSQFFFQQLQIMSGYHGNVVIAYPWSIGDNNLVAPAVEVVHKAEYLLASGEEAGQANRHHVCFLAAGEELYLLHCRHVALNQLRPCHLILMIFPVVGAPGHLFLYRLDNSRMGVPQYQGAMSHDVVKIFITIDVPLAGPLCSCDVGSKRVENSGLVSSTIGGEKA